MQKNQTIRKLLITIAAFCFSATAMNAQLWRLNRYEISGGIGTTQFFGDVGGYSNGKNVLGIKDFTFLQTRYNINTNFRYRIDEDVSVRVNLVFGVLHATDSRGSNVSRGFESTTMFFEPSLIGEFYFIKNTEENSFVFVKDHETLLKSFFKSLDFYAFTGFGGLAYHVKPNDVLLPFVPHTSGFTGVVPLGFGISMLYSGSIKFGIEFGGRFTLSDNLDGYTSPKSQYNDIYHLVNFTITYKIKTGKRR